MTPEVKTIRTENHSWQRSGSFYYNLRNAVITRMFRRDVQKRAVLKNGDCNIAHVNVRKRRRRYLVDIFTTLVDTKWRYNVIVFSMGFFLSWLAFAVIWWYIIMKHGDFNHLDDLDWQPCVANINSFTSVFLFSIETQHTIGYGWRRITTECPSAIFLMCVQCIAGVVIQAFLAGIMFARLSRPTKRSQTLMFSNNAVVSLRDGKLCLMFRIADMRKTHIIVAQVHAQLIKKRTTLEGEAFSDYLTDVAFVVDTCSEHLFFIWPFTVVHIIDEKSPFYGMSARGLLQEHFEIVVTLDGVIESTGATTQARSSYLPSEILWGHRFKQLLFYSKEDEKYKVDYSEFNHTYQVDTPLCSAKELNERRNFCDNLRMDLPFAPKPYNRMVKNHSCESLKSHNGVCTTTTNTMSIWCISGGLTSTTAASGELKAVQLNHMTL